MKIELKFVVWMEDGRWKMGRVWGVIGLRISEGSKSWKTWNINKGQRWEVLIGRL